MLKYFLRFSFFFFPVLVWAKAPFWVPKDIRIGYDIGKQVARLWSTKNTHEGILHLYFGKILLCVEGGKQIIFREAEVQNSRYKNQGSFLCLGVDYNFLKESPEHNICSIGLRYAMSHFQETVDTFTKDESELLQKPRVWKDQRVLFEQQLSAHWLEAVGGVGVSLWKNFFVGVQAKIKFKKKIKGTEKMQCFEIPGWGFGDVQAYGDVHYYVLYTFYFR